MAFSTKRAMGGRGALPALAWAVLLALALALATLCPASARAEEFVERPADSPLAVQTVSASAFGYRAEAGAGGAIEAARFCPLELLATADPDGADVGISCGMDWMCGLDPCLCGSSDAWGSCSCNGMQHVEPSFSYVSFDESVVRVAEAFGRTWLVPVGKGEAALEVSAAMAHHEDAVATVTVRVGALVAPDAMIVGIALMACAAAALVIVLAVRMRRKR